MTKLTVGSLFSGIGGLELGLEQTGHYETLFQVEKDAFCQKVLARHWPHVMRFDDVRDVGRHNAPNVDVLCGGFPCQDISAAGHGSGLIGGRSKLWWEFLRIIREIKPRYVIIENVKALINRGLLTILRCLDQCGYDAEWSVVSARDMGAPHLRDRVFVVAHADRRRRETSHDKLESTSKHIFEKTHNRSWEENSKSDRGFSGRVYLVPKTNIHRMAYGVPSRLDKDRLKALGNAVVPAVGRFVGDYLWNIHENTVSISARGD